MDTFCLEPLNSEILISVAQGANKLQIFTSGSYSEWRISESDLKETCLTWLKSFEFVELVLPTNDFSLMSEVHKEDLLALKNMGVTLYCVASSVPVNKGSLLIQTSYNDRATSYATNSLEASVPSINWWNFDDFYLIKTNKVEQIRTSEIDHKLLTIQKKQGDIEIEICSELDGSLGDFGDKLWCVLMDNSESLKDSFNDSSKLKTITYTDSYICSPWSLLLFAEVIDSLKASTSDNWDNPDIYLLTGEKPPSPYAKGLYAEWKTNNVKTSVLAAYLKEIGLKTNVDIKPMRDLPHGRTLSLEWDNDTVTTIRFDHGVGCWSIAKAPKGYFDIKAKADIQASKLVAMFKDIEVRYNKKFPTQLFIKQR